MDRPLHERAADVFGARGKASKNPQVDLSSSRPGGSHAHLAAAKTHRNDACQRMPKRAIVPSLRSWHVPV